MCWTASFKHNKDKRCPVASSWRIKCEKPSILIVLPILMMENNSKAATIIYVKKNLQQKKIGGQHQNSFLRINANSIFK